LGCGLEQEQAFFRRGWEHTPTAGFFHQCGAQGGTKKIALACADCFHAVHGILTFRQGNPHPVSAWGQPAKGYKTRRRKYTDTFIVKRRN
jgi:hypothetical protein